MSAANVLAFLIQEMRSVRRSTRTWVFAVLAVGSAFTLYVYLFGAHGFGQATAPRLNVPGFGVLALYVVLLGVFTLVFDGRHRDEQAEIAEALYARPFWNLELHAGRLLAVALVAWLSLVALTLLVLAFEGFVAQSSQSYFGSVAEPATALATFVILDAPPALLFWGALATLLGAVLRHRLLTLLVLVSMLALHFLALLHLPLFLIPSFSGITNLGLAGSEILPRTPGLADLGQRGGVLALALAWLLLACPQPRRDGSNVALLGAVLMVVGCGAVGGLGWVANERQNVQRDWATVHVAGAQGVPADLERIAGHIGIDPGRELTVSVDLHIVLTEETEILSFSLNPGMHVANLLVDGAVAAHSHDLGVLDVVLRHRLAAGARAVVHIEASGIPDERFAYLDSALDVMGQSLMGSPLALLGERSSLFTSGYVALMPGVRWLPHPGVTWGTDDMPDFHHIDVAVSLPPGWWPAGAGRMGDSAPWRFRTAVPVANLALIAAPFERRALRIAGIECELLVHPRHIRQFERLSAEVLRATVADFLTARLTTTGLQYPHRTFSIVEAPAQLRRYGGGWRMGTVQALPGIQLLAEHGLPTARFGALGQEGAAIGAHSALLARIDGFGANGIPLTTGFARNLLPFLTSATGEGAFALDFLVEALTARVAMGEHRVAPGSWLHASVPSNSSLTRAILRVVGTATVRSAWFDYMPEFVETRSERTPLNRVDPHKGSEHVDVLIHKGDQLASLIESVMGHEKTRRFLGLLRQRHVGATFTEADFMDALGTLEPKLPPLIKPLFESASLPGFLVSSVRAARIRDLEDEPRYQINVDVRNDEATVGVAAISWRTETGGTSQWQLGPHVIVPGHESREIGATSSAAPVEARLDTFLSLNRRALPLPLPDFDQQASLDWEPFDGARKSDWKPRPEGIVVDDQDAGFSVRHRKGLVSAGVNDPPCGPRARAFPSSERYGTAGGVRRARMPWRGGSTTGRSCANRVAMAMRRHVSTRSYRRQGAGGWSITCPEKWYVSCAIAGFAMTRSARSTSE